MKVRHASIFLWKRVYFQPLILSTRRRDHEITHFAALRDFPSNGALFELVFHPSETKDPEKKAKSLVAEINNGRLAMFAIIGVLASRLIIENSWYRQLFGIWKATLGKNRMCNIWDIEVYIYTPYIMYMYLGRGNFRYLIISSWPKKFFRADEVTSYMDTHTHILYDHILFDMFELIRQVALN